MRTIVVGVDGSDPSLRALEFATSLAGETPTEIVAVHARHLPALWAPPHVPEAEFGDILDVVEQEVRQRVDGKLAERAVKYRIECREGEPSAVICDVARETDAYLVIIGRSGWTTVHELLLGSVSNRLVHRADVPLLLVS